MNYKVVVRKHPEVNPTVAHTGSKESCVEYVQENYSGLKQYENFDNDNFANGQGAYYADLKGIEVAILPEDYE
jgi:hypothetical protein